jgi:hypothetical protein
LILDRHLPDCLFQEAAGGPLGVALTRSQFTTVSLLSLSFSYAHTQRSVSTTRLLIASDLCFDAKLVVRLLPERFADNCPTTCRIVHAFAAQLELEVRVGPTSSSSLVIIKPARCLTNVTSLNCRFVLGSLLAFVRTLTRGEQVFPRVAGSGDTEKLQPVDNQAVEILSSNSRYTGANLDRETPNQKDSKLWF